MAARPHDDKSPLDHLLDLTVYAPIGLLMSLEEVVPQLVEKGHQHVQVARFFGRMAVRTSGEEARKRIDRATKTDRGRPAPPDGAAAPTTNVTPIRPVAAPAAAAASAAPPEPVPEPDELGITDYDVLSASQVVPRLPGLSAEELDAVRRYESAHRGRKTILSKIAQLQG